MRTDSTKEIVEALRSLGDAVPEIASRWVIAGLADALSAPVDRAAPDPDDVGKRYFPTLMEYYRHGRSIGFRLLAELCALDDLPEHLDYPKAGKSDLESVIHERRKYPKVSKI